MTKLSIFFSIILILLVSWYYISSWNLKEEDVILKKTDLKIPIPPYIRTQERKKNSYFLDENPAACKYAYKEIQGVPCIVESDDPSYMWKFYGVVLEKGNMLAVFFNPKTGEIRLLKEMDRVDKDLVLKSLTPFKAIVEFKEKKFVLKIFETRSIN